MSGAVAERCRFEAYIFYSLYMSMWVYPLVAHWTWSPHGWATPFLNWTSDANGVLVPNPEQSLLFTTGVYDFAGSGVVHLVGGTASFWAALALGPRIGRFDGEGKVCWNDDACCAEYMKHIVFSNTARRHARTQHILLHPRCLHPVVWLVRLQPRLAARHRRLHVLLRHPRR